MSKQARMTKQTGSHSMAPDTKVALAYVAKKLVFAAAATLALLALTPRAYSATCADADTPATQLSQTAAEQAVLCLVNEERTARGIPVLTFNERLRAAARQHAQDAARIKWWDGGGEKIHTNPETGSTAQSRIKDAGYCSAEADPPRNENGYENWYKGGVEFQGDTKPRAAVNTFWMNSEGHKRTLLDPAYRESGVAVVLGVAVKNTLDADGNPLVPDGGAIFVQTFGGCAQVSGAQPGGGDTTRRFIKVHFRKMRVHNCNEGGICEWKLTCSLGNQEEKVLSHDARHPNSVEADDRDEPPIDRVLNQEGDLPVTLVCNVKERDAPIWEEIGTRSLTIQQAGPNQSIRIADLDEDGDVDEGDVSIFFDVESKIGQPLVNTPTTQSSDTLLALHNVGIDFSVPEADLRQWLNNPSFTPYPALAAALLNLLEGKRLRQPVFIDVIRSKYEDVLGASSPRSVADIDLALLKAAVVESYNERYGESESDFERLMR